MKKDEFRINIEEVKLDRSLFPREKLDKNTVKRYREDLDVLPPILLGKDNTLIDGWHRFEAHRLEEQKTILAEYSDVPQEEYFIEANRANSTHGNPMTSAEKRRNAQRLFLRHGMTGDEISQILGISERHGRRLVETFSKSKKRIRDQVVLDLFEKDLSFRDIETETGVSKSSAQRIVKAAQSPTPVVDSVIVDDSKESKESFEAFAVEAESAEAKSVVPGIGLGVVTYPLNAITKMKANLGKIGMVASTYDSVMKTKIQTAIKELETTCSEVSKRLATASD